MKSWQTLLNKALNQGERKNKEKRPKFKAKAEKSKGYHEGGKGTNYVPEPPPPHQSQEEYRRKKKEMKPERAVSLEEPAPATRNFGLLVVSSHSICNKVLG